VPTTRHGRDLWSDIPTAWGTSVPGWSGCPQAVASICHIAKAAYGVRLPDIEGSAVSELRSPKQQREHLVRSLRAEGKSWVEVAEVLRQRYHINARVAFRYAHGWS
jgi:hypothetical protein